MSSFDLTSTPSTSNLNDYHPPTAQSTPVMDRNRQQQQLLQGQQQQHLQQHLQHLNVIACSSVLTTPNNSVVNSSSGGGGGNSTATAAAANSGGDRGSPVRSHHARLSEAPRTPTPFKKALADVYQRREPLSRTVRSLRGHLHSRFLRPFLRPRWRRRPTASFARSRT
jgi:hypothetical protein